LDSANFIRIDFGCSVAGIVIELTVQKGVKRSCCRLVFWGFDLCLQTV